MDKTDIPDIRPCRQEVVSLANEIVRLPNLLRSGRASVKLTIRAVLPSLRTRDPADANSLGSLITVSKN